MKGVEATRIVVGIIGNLISLGLFASPLPTFRRIIRNKSVEEFKPDPYLAAAMNCIFWIFYGLPVIHPDSTLVVTINSVGLAMELSYLIVFFLYCDNKQRRWIIVWLGIEAVFTAAIAVAAILGFHTHNSRSNFVGGFCVVFGIMLYGSPLTIIRKVIRTQSVEYMPFWLSLASFSNGVIWTIYACLKFDPYIFTGNSVGTILGAAQLVVYCYYSKETPKSGKQQKPTEVLQKPTERQRASV